MADIPSKQKESDFSAIDPMLGYLFQCRYALLASLVRLKRGKEFSVFIEAIDDVSFDIEGDPSEVLQTKHHLNKADLPPEN